jgi:hypothetical protein
MQRAPPPPTDDEDGLGATDDGALSSDAADGAEGGSAASADADGDAENAGDRPASAPKALTAAQVCPCVSTRENDIETLIQEYFV